MIKEETNWLMDFI